MRKALLMLFLLIPSGIFAAYWPEDVIIALEMQDTLADSGHGGYEWDNYGNVKFTTRLHKYGRYSLGMFPNGAYVKSRKIIKEEIKTIEIWFYNTGDRMHDLAGYDNSFFRLAVGGHKFSDTAYTQDITAEYTMKTWHRMQVDLDGNTVTWYIDGKIAGQEPDKHILINGDFILGNFERGKMTGFQGYINRFVASTKLYNGREIKPLNIDVTSTITPTPNAKETRVAKTATMQAILSFTPTPFVKLKACQTPFPAVFTPNPTPVFTAKTGYEKGSVQEPNVIMGPDGLLHMTYSCGGFTNAETIGLATAAKPEGPWKRYGNSPIMGGGYGGIKQNCSMSSQLHIGNEWRIYFTVHGTGNVYYATSADGYHYKCVTTPVDNFLDFKKTICDDATAGFDGAGEIFSWKGSYYSLSEVYMSSCRVTLMTYALWLMKDFSGKATDFHPVSPVWLQSADPHDPTSGVLAGGRAVMIAGDKVHIWTHVGLPTNIYHAQSMDLYNWLPDPVPVVKYNPAVFGLPACSQVADASIIEYNGALYLFYDGVDNANYKAAIGYAEYPGTAADYDACLAK